MITHNDLDDDTLYGDTANLKIDVKLPRDMRKLNDELQDADPFEQEQESSKTTDSAESKELLQLSRILRYYPFMRFFNACARSMYLSEQRGKRMYMFSIRHPIFRKVCMLGDLLFTALCSVIILAVMLLILARFAGIPMPWE